MSKDEMSSFTKCVCPEYVVKTCGIWYIFGKGVRNRKNKRIHIVVLYGFK